MPGLTGSYSTIGELRYEETDKKYQYKLRTFSFDDGDLIGISITGWLDILPLPVPGHLLPWIEEAIDGVEV